VKKTRVVILGGGFAGMRTAECLEEQFRSSASLSVTLVSETNALLFTPMLAEVAGSSLEPSHISTPLRSSLHQTEFIRGSRGGNRSGGTLRDSAKRFRSGWRGASGRKFPTITSSSRSARSRTTWAWPISKNIPSTSRACSTRFAFAITSSKCSSAPTAKRTPARRRALLTFVIAGGGFAGVELAGALNDYARGIVVDYPKLRRDDLSIVLVHSRDRILPELSETLGRYAQRKMEERGVTFRLNTRLTDAQPGLVTLSDGAIHAETLVWTAGTAPNPLTKSLPLAKDKRGALIVDRHLQVQDQPGLWAVGDCAAVVDAKTGQPCPPTAQFALREAQTLAGNIRAQPKTAACGHFISIRWALSAW
jgi:NADH:ubiquinone reductase (H+-translocating)